MEVEERLLDNHAWTWNEKPFHHIPPKRVQNMHGVWPTRHGGPPELMKDDDYIIACKGRKEEANFW